MGAQAACNTKNTKFTTIPAKADWKLDPEAAYVHYCMNETVNGVEFSSIPDVGSVPLVADMSSNFCSRPIEAGKHAYAPGPGGHLRGHHPPRLRGRRQGDEDLPHLLQLEDHGRERLHVQHAGLLYALRHGRVPKVHQEGGWHQALGEMSAKKSGMIYDVIDKSDGFYCCPVEKKSRSRMNLPFTIMGGNEEVEKKFLDGAKKEKLYTLAGHRSVGGCRASLYNGMPLEGVDKLRDFMESFMSENRK